ncbi:gliding motility-associated C-terminal domain-containing protein [Aureisphaera galaxeae]|uniref:gliding motility-associated C-terminal domain-containing protein n=1 Tax=Aureisphaera galaxeae TaxID=1538023 RepID=UPI0023501C62|nr:gliding motility-associated C-terminal domain-containing protein [Aureisphaera galaxeae]
MNIQRFIVRTALLLLFGCSTSLLAQTANYGEMTVLPNTEVGVMNDFNNTPSGTVFNDGDVYLYADFNNDGVVDYIDGGMTRFRGFAIQDISGTNTSYLYDVEFSNGSSVNAFQLSGSLNVANEATFDEGVVDNDTFGGTFQFEQNAVHFQTSHASHVDGEVIKVGDTGFQFPIGDGGFFRPAAISAPSNNNHTFTGHYFHESSDTPGTPHNLAAGVIERIDDTEYWLVERTAGTSDILLTLGWDENTSPSFITNANPNAIHIVRWDEAQGFWVDMGGVADAANDEVTTIVEVDGYGIFTLALVKTEEILPDDVVIYTGVSVNDNDKNDFFFIDGIDRYPNNEVKIFNRWGVEVFSTRGYNETNNVFRGYSAGRLTIDKNRPLPTGTYYYILEYDFPGSEQIPAQRVRRAGFLYLETQ